MFQADCLHPAPASTPTPHEPAATHSIPPSAINEPQQPSTLEIHTLNKDGKLLAINISMSTSSDDARPHPSNDDPANCDDHDTRHGDQQHPTNHNSSFARKFGSVKSAISEKTANFFKIVEDDECKELWNDRQKRLISRTCGKIKCPVKPSIQEKKNIQYAGYRSNGDASGDADGTDSGPFASESLLASGDAASLEPAAAAAAGAPSALIRTPFCRKSAIRIAGDSIKKTFSPKTEASKDVTDGIKDEVKKSFKEIHDEVKPFSDEDIDTFDDHRPYLTYFLMISQTLILALALLRYGFGPWGITHKTHDGQVRVPSMSLQHVEYKEPQNFWLGPPATALIHLGAKFAPCMRKDRLVYEKVHEERLAERNTACCVRNDESGCAQTTKERCSPLLSTWRKWGENLPGPDMVTTLPKGSYRHNRTSGTVCGQDPRYCSSPASQQPFEWPDDITAWPICQVPSRPRLADEHMTCEVIAKPCCIGVYGQCVITTQDYCEFVKGHFHEEATLCSQISCMSDVCGLLPFVFNDRPDQLVRVITSTFLHAGVIHLACSLTFYLVFMRDIERAVGPLRLGIIYMASGIAGNLASATFVPYRAEAGPAGSILGVMACLIVIIIYHWNELQNPYRQLVLKVSLTMVFFICGLLFPWIDNFAHFAGFIVGFFLSLALIPFVNIGRTYDPKQKRILIWVGFAIFIVSCVTLMTFFYFPIYECAYCKYFNCLLSIFHDDLCPDQDFKVTRVDIL